MANHTPGPWEMFSTEDGVGVFGSGNSDVASCRSYRYCLDSRRDVKEDEANARLMAAAPDLLEALKIALTQLTEDSNAQGRLEAAGWAAAAIAKAEARS